jgi:hypothetical protein
VEPWTPHDDQRLKELKEAGAHWDSISHELRRTVAYVKVRYYDNHPEKLNWTLYRMSDKPPGSRRWTDEEDILLLRARASRERWGQAAD